MSTPQFILNILGNNQIENILTSLGIFAAAFLALKIFKTIIIQKLKSLSKKTETDIDDVFIQIIQSINWPFYLLISVFIAAQFIQLSARVEKVFGYIAILTVAYYLVRALQKLIEFSLEKLHKKEKGLDRTLINLINKLSSWLLWLIVIIIILQNFGFNVSTLLGGLGVAGIAIAFALQNVLADIFASFSIYLDRPFKIGDFIAIGEDSGTVEKIGLKSTRLKTLQGQELIISNKELTESRVQNYKRMKERRIVFVLGVAYETPSQKLKKIPKIVKDIFAEIKIVRLDRVHFKEFAPSSLNFEVVYFMQTADYQKYMNTQQKINFALKDVFEKEGIVIAYPTQTIYLNKST